MQITFPFCTHDVTEAIKDNRLVKSWQDEENIYFMIKRKTKPDTNKPIVCRNVCRRWIQKSKQGVRQT